MERRIVFTEKPTVMDWGEQKIVPLNITEVVENVDGEKKVSYLADVVKKVNVPVTVDSIVDAAIAEEYDEAAQRRIMRNFAKQNDAEVKQYKSFVQEVTTYAEEAFGKK